MAKQLTCPHCGEKFTPVTNTRAQKDKFGFEEGSKGSFVANLIMNEPGIAKRELIDRTTEKFGTESTGRVTMVLHQLRQRGFLQREKGYTVSS